MSTSLDSSMSRNIEELSQLLFVKIKPLCVQLSQEVAGPTLNVNRIASLVAAVQNCLQMHLKDNQDECKIYRISESIADYIFFPFSSLLRQPQLDDSIIHHFLSVLGFLMEYAWSFNVKYQLIDQLFPLIIFLSARDMKTSPSQISKKSLEFKDSVCYALSVITKLVDQDYFQALDQDKRLIFLSNTVSILLDTITATTPDSQESIKVIIQSLKTVSRLANNLSPNRQSQILPGIVSSVTNFVIKNPNLNHRIIICILSLLSSLISNSFNDKELNSKLDLFEPTDLTDVATQWNETGDVNHDDFNISISTTESEHRTLSWTKATSKQLKLALVLMFKTMLLDSRNRQRWRTKTSLYDSVVGFIRNIVQSSFITLFLDFAPLTIDVLAILTFVSSYDDDKENIAKQHLLSDSIFASVLSEDYTLESTFYLLVQSKLSDLVSNKLPSLMLSTDEDKISMNIIAIQFHFILLTDLTRRKPSAVQVAHSLRMECISQLHRHLIEGYEMEHVKRPVASFRLDKPSLETESQTVTLDSIELPGYINTRNIVKQQMSTNKKAKPYLHNLQLIASQWNEADVRTYDKMAIMGISSHFIETKVKLLIVFLSSLKIDTENDTLHDLEDVIEIKSSQDELLNEGMSLWMASNYLRGCSKVIETDDGFDPDEFLILEDEHKTSIDHDNNLEQSYLILAKAEDLISTLSEKSQDQLKHSSIVAFTAALDAVDAVVGTIDKDSFQEDFLMDYLLTLFQALTYNDFPQIQLQARVTLSSVLTTYYDNSMKSLIMDNLDYLINSISLQMSVAGSLTPMLPGILLIIVKICGIQLLESNQLNDILTEMFVILDAYHGYNTIVESFFIVFESLIEQVRGRYDSTPEIEHGGSVNRSPFKPWGITNAEQLLNLISSADRSVDPFDGYDSNTEYFKRPGDVPFSDTPSDSDDEDESANEEEPETPWPSLLPKKIYFILQQIFNYGFILLSQPSYSLKSQIIKTLRQIFPLLCTNFKLVLPLITNNWPLITTLICGTETLSTINIMTGRATTEDTSLIVQSLEFATEILTQDSTHEEFFFGRKFQETWDFLANHSRLVPKELSHPKSSQEKLVTLSSRSLSSLRINIKLRTSLVKFLITGLQNYERIIPVIIRHRIVELCYHLQIPEDVVLTRDTKGILEILRIRNCKA